MLYSIQLMTHIYRLTYKSQGLSAAVDDVVKLNMSQIYLLSTLTG